MITIHFNPENNFLTITYSIDSNLSINQNLSIECHNVTGKQIQQAINIYNILTNI